MYLGPNPNSECINMLLFKSVKLNQFPVPHKNTTGNSSPLLLCILIILITSSFSPNNFGAPISLLFLVTLSIKFIKLYNPLKLPFS